MRREGKEEGESEQGLELGRHWACQMLRDWFGSGVAHLHSVLDPQKMSIDGDHYSSSPLRIA